MKVSWVILAFFHLSTPNGFLFEIANFFVCKFLLIVLTIRQVKNIFFCVFASLPLQIDTFSK